MPDSNEIKVGGSVGGNAFIGDHNTIGDVVGTAAARDALRGEVRATLGALRTEVAAKDDATPGKEVALDQITELEEIVDSEDADPAVAKHVATKLSQRLTGALAVSISLADLAAKVSGLFG
ncbi:MAG TPA: hypothetical protein VNO31_01880 [Umezawaea sp.]|nr:hypothetical protein [Umezawaea sp.]